MKSKIMKSTMISTAIALAMGLSVAQLHADDQAAGQINPPTTGQQISDDVNRAAADREAQRNMSSDAVDAEEFVDTASAKAIAGINTARLALEEGSPALQVYANKIIEDHTVTNNELKAIADRTNLEVADEATLADRARTMVLSVRSGDSFDEAFINNQIDANEEAIELFQRVANSDHPELSAFARGKLPGLQEHLAMANALKVQISSL